jgi:mannonate dehydratase
MKYLEQTWRWYGPDDPITLKEIRQTGATGIVTALHHIPVGDTWPIEEIQKRKKLIEDAGLRWSVVESVNVHDEIKAAGPNRQQYIKNYKETIHNLGQSDVRIVCYNFMPALDWTRTNLNLELSSGAIALDFDYVDAIVFDRFILKREDSEGDYSAEQIEQASIRQESMTDEQISALSRTILQGLPGGARGFTMEEFENSLRSFQDVNADRMRENLGAFLTEVVPVAEHEGVNLAIHPDDPPFSLFGLARVVSTEQDLAGLLKVIDSPANGLCFCTGSLGARSENDVTSMARRFAGRVNFVHLRNVQIRNFRSFHESDHLEGSVDMFEVVRQLSIEQQQRDSSIPYRPDHGHILLDDVKRKTNPGYPLIGRMKGLAELRGLEMAIVRSISNENKLI